MSSDHPTLTISRGDSLDSVQRSLQLTAPPDQIPDPEFVGSFYHLDELGFWVFFNQDSCVYSIRFESPFRYDIEGIRIGDAREEVIRTRGKPHRKLPIPDAKERWVYDRPRFLRIDFDPETDRVETIFR